MTPNELLNDILNWFATNPNAKPTATITEVTIDFSERFGNNKEIWFGNLKVELIKVVQKLENDKYIVPLGGNSESNEEEYTITFEGIVFNSNGGYVKQKQKETIAKKLKHVETCAIAIGTALAGLYALYSFFKEINFCNCN
ncbi:MAG: hypothetical protein A3K10_13790 [Bacteroidetes bacterium RIFCSPLOWO2_12_FULL_31_6]|nr:MAG: hypothetical protein A3K10_13790 [Bacteroidetes bacterium RIFCSPLOWO2_12_FULL_31_6]